MGLSEIKVIKNSLDMDFVKVPSGSFLMGSNESEHSLRIDFPEYGVERLNEFCDESPLHKVIISKSFWMGQYPVTVEQFGNFVTHSGYVPESVRDQCGGYGFNPDDIKVKENIDEVFDGRDKKYSWYKVGFFQDDQFPVVNITWNDANAMARWLSEREGRKYRLPTEAEWEYACRAGSNGRYFTGDNPSTLISYAKVFDLATAKIWPQWYSYALKFQSHFDFSAPVGSYLPNAFGLYDMIGNVWEWCSDWYDPNYYEYSQTTDPQGPDIGETKVRRGGSWHSWPLYCRSSFRNVNTPESRYLLVGMRLVLEADE